MRRWQWEEGTAIVKKIIHDVTTNSMMSFNNGTHHNNAGTHNYRMLIIQVNVAYDFKYTETNEFASGADETMQNSTLVHVQVPMVQE